MSKSQTQLEFEVQTLQAQVAELQRQLEQARNSAQVPDDQRLRQLLNILPVGVSILDHEHNVVFENATLKNLLGLTTGQLRTGEYKKRKYLAHDGTDLSPDQFASAQARRTGAPIYNVETGIVKESGEITWLNVSALPVDLGDWQMVVVSGDITQQKQMETRQRETEVRYQTLFENSLDGLSVFDSKSNIVLANRRAAEIYGYDSPEEMIGLNTFTFLPPDEQVRAREIARSRTSASTHFDQFRLLHKDGTEFMGETGSTMIPDQHGNPSGLVLGIVRDITARQRLEATLRESEQRYTLLFQKSATPVFLLKLPEVMIKDANEAAEKLTGYTREEMLGRNAAELGLISQATREVTIRQFERAKALASNEMRIIDKSGAEHIIVVNTNPLEIAGEPFALTSMQDITEHKQLEAARASLTERLDLAAHAAHLGIWDWDIQKNELVWDEEMYALYGLQPGQFGGAYEAWLNGVHPEDREASNQVSSQAVRGERDYDTEFRAVWPDGAVHWLKATGAVFRAKDGTPLRMVGINYDITERKQAEAALRQSEQKYSALFAKSAVPAALTKMPEASFVDVNDAFQSTYGYSREEVLGKTSLEIGMTRPDEYAQTRASLQEASTLLDSEKHLFTKSGQVRIATINISKVLIDNQDYVITTIHDVTERKRAEVALLQSQRNFMGAFEANPAGLAITRRVDGKFLLINPAYSTIMGYSAAELIGHTVAEFSIYVDPEQRTQVLQQMAEQGTVHNYELAVRDRSGQHREILVSMEPILYDQEDCLLSAFIDITERRQIEKALHDSEERFTRAFQTSPIAQSITVVETGVILEVNAAFCTLLGYPREELLGRSTVDLHLWNEAGERAAAAEQLRTVGHVYSQQATIHTRSGAVRTVLVSVEPIVWQGQICAISSSVDITERQQAEERLDYQATLLTNVSDAIISTDINLRVIYWNKAAEQIFGWTAEEVLGQGTAELLKAQFPHSSRAETLQGLMETGHYDGELRYVRKSGDYFDAHARSVVLKDDQGNFTGVVTSIRDITERKQAEKNLRLSEERLRLSLQAANQGLYDLNPQTGAAIVNDEYALMLGYDPAAFHETHAFWLERMHPEDRALAAQVYQDYVEGRLPEYRVEFRQRMRNGAWKWILSMGRILEWDADGQPLRMLGTHTDLNARKQMEEDLRRSNAELEQFAYVASHDLQEPLRAVAGMVQLLGQRYQGQLDERADEYIRHAVEAAARMQSLITDLLAYSRVDRRNQMIEPVAAEACLQAALKNLGVLIHETHAVITAEPLPMVDADATQLTQLFQNLIGNGIKFRGEHDPQIQVSVTKLKEAWQFSVRDNGIGIEAEYFERIFLVFQRLHTRREYPGTGIGLAICKKIVERHGGQLWVESSPGAGSTFHFTLPLRNHHDE